MGTKDTQFPQHLSFGNIDDEMFAAAIAFIELSIRRVNNQLNDADTKRVSISLGHIVRRRTVRNRIDDWATKFEIPLSKGNGDSFWHRENGNYYFQVILETV